MALLNRGYRREIEALVQRIEKIETALEPDFQRHFVAAMALPNKIDRFPSLERVVTLPERAGRGPPWPQAPARRVRAVPEEGELHSPCCALENAFVAIGLREFSGMPPRRDIRPWLFAPCWFFSMPSP